MTDSKDFHEFDKLKANLQEALGQFGKDVADACQKLTVRRGDVPEPFVGISEIYHLRAQVKELIKDQETSDQTINELRSEIKERDRLIEIEREKVEVSLTKNTVLRNTIHELHNRIERLEAEAEVRNCSEPYRKTNIELQEQIKRLQEALTERDKTTIKHAKRISELNFALSGIRTIIKNSAATID